MTSDNDISPNREKSNTLIMEAVALMINAESLDNTKWDALSLVIGCSAGSTSSGGYVYSGIKYNGWTPESNEFLRKIEELRITMPNKDGRYWRKALIRVTKPDLKFTIDVDYEDEERWDIKVKSLDQIDDYANSLRPK